MSFTRLLWILAILAASLTGFQCSSDPGGPTPPDDPDPPDPPDLVFAWNEPDSLRNVVTAPVTLSLAVGDSLQIDHLRIFADGEEIARLDGKPYDHEWTEENGAGRLVIALPALHGFVGVDMISVFVLDD